MMMYDVCDVHHPTSWISEKGDVKRKGIFFVVVRMRVLLTVNRCV